MHPTLLPEGRGRAPIPWTIIKGLKQTGVTTFLLEDTADSGGIVLQERISVTADETATSLFNKVGAAHHRLGNRLAPILADNRLKWEAQDESRASTWSKRTPEDGLIDFTADTETISRLVRALTSPYPGAFFYCGPAKVTVRKVVTDSKPRFRPGAIVSLLENGNPVIAAGDGVVECTEIEFETNRIPFLVGSVVTAALRREEA